MQLSDEDFVQKNWGTANPGGTTSLVIPLTGGNNPDGVGTTAGNTVLVCTASSTTNVTPPPGWATNVDISGRLQIFLASDIPAGETSWTFTLGVANSLDVDFVVIELSNIDLVDPLETSSTSLPGGLNNGGTLSTRTTSMNAALDTVEIAVFTASGSVGASWSDYTNDFEEVQETNGGAARIAVARKFTSGTTGQFETTATLASSGPSSTVDAVMLVYRAVGSPIMAPLSLLLGFEPGTLGGINSHNGITNLLGSSLASQGGAWGTNYFVQAGSARNSGHGLRIVQTGSSGFVVAGSFSGSGFAFGMDLRVVSATGQVVVGSFASYFQILYNTATNKFGVRAGTTGAISWQSGTTALGAFAWIDLRIKLSTTTWRVEWEIEESEEMVAQAAAELAGQSAFPAANANLAFGSSLAQTMTADFDNVVASNFYAAFPLPPHTVRMLVPAGTVGYQGTPGNFALVTNNATGAALAGSGGNISTSGVAATLDEVPPNASGTSDGVVQTTTAATDYLQFPFADPIVADDEIVAGVRMLAALISTTGAGAGNLAIRGWDGSAETALASVTGITPGAPTALSATAPRWLCAMWQQANGWTVTKLIAAALRGFFSSDATPDMGVLFMGLEYAVRKTQAVPVFGESGAPLRVEQDTDPNTLGIRALRVYTPANQSASLKYELSGIEQTPVPVAANSNPHTVVIDAESAAVVNRIELAPNEPV